MSSGAQPVAFSIGSKSGQMVPVSQAVEDVCNTKEGNPMTSARAIEYRITRQLADRHTEQALEAGLPVAGRLICAVALAGGMLLFGSVMPELLGALLAAGALAALGGE